MTDTSLAERRMALVREHMEAENVHDYETVMETFSHPRYELIASGQVFDGDARVRDYFRLSRAAFPDQRNELISMRHADDAVIIEFWLMGTHKGPLTTPNGEIPPTGRSFRTQICSIFLFEGEKIVCERVYFDQLSIMTQLTGAA
ncbi:MAG: ester cyclase [Parvularculaceae bacterium]